MSNYHYPLSILLLLSMLVQGACINKKAQEKEKATAKDPEEIFHRDAAQPPINSPRQSQQPASPRRQHATQDDIMQAMERAQQQVIAKGLQEMEEIENFARPLSTYLSSILPLYRNLEKDAKKLYKYYRWRKFPAEAKKANFTMQYLADLQKKNIMLNANRFQFNLRVKMGNMLRDADMTIPRRNVTTMIQDANYLLLLTKKKHTKTRIMAIISALKELKNALLCLQLGNQSGVEENIAKSREHIAPYVKQQR